MKNNVHLIILIIIFILSFSALVVAVPQNVSVSPNHWMKALPKVINLNLVLSLEGSISALKKPVIIEFKIENISEFEQEVDFSNIVVNAQRNKQELFSLFSLKDKLNCKIVLPKGTFTSIKIPLSNVYKIDKPGEYILWAYYNLPDDKGINSNDLEITITP